jgi:hypothetical protein
MSNNKIDKVNVQEEGKEEEVKEDDRKSLTNRLILQLR